MRGFLIKQPAFFAVTKGMVNFNEGVHLAVSFSKWCLVGAGSLVICYIGIKLIVMLLFLNILYTI